jgi:hypothetical protein
MQDRTVSLRRTFFVAVCMCSNLFATVYAFASFLSESNLALQPAWTSM